MNPITIEVVSLKNGFPKTLGHVYESEVTDLDQHVLGRTVNPKEKEDKVSGRSICRFFLPILFVHKSDPSVFRALQS
jgi:hypothetical protein